MSSAKKLMPVVHGRECNVSNSHMDHGFKSVLTVGGAAATGLQHRFASFTRDGLPAVQFLETKMRVATEGWD